MKSSSASIDWFEAHMLINCGQNELGKALVCQGVLPHGITTLNVRSSAAHPSRESDQLWEIHEAGEKVG